MNFWNNLISRHQNSGSDGSTADTTNKSASGSKKSPKQQTKTKRFGSLKKLSKTVSQGHVNDETAEPAILIKPISQNNPSQFYSANQVFAKQSLKNEKKILHEISNNTSAKMSAAATSFTIIPVGTTNTENSDNFLTSMSKSSAAEAISYTEQNYNFTPQLFENSAQNASKMITSAQTTNPGATTIHIGDSYSTLDESNILLKRKLFPETTESLSASDNISLCSSISSTQTVSTARSFSTSKPKKVSKHVSDLNLTLLNTTATTNPIESDTTQSIYSASMSFNNTMTISATSSVQPLIFSSSRGSEQFLHTDFFNKDNNLSTMENNKKLYRKVSLMPLVTEEDLKSSNLGVRDPVSVAQVFGEAFASKFCNHSIIPTTRPSIQMNTKQQHLIKQKNFSSDDAIRLQIPSIKDADNGVLNPKSPLPYDSAKKMLRKDSLSLEATPLPFEIRDSNLPE